METLTITTNQPITGPMTDWLTCEEASERSGYSAQYVRRLCRAGRIDCVLKGRMYLINPKDLDRYVEEMKSLGSDKFNWRRLLE